MHRSDAFGDALSGQGVQGRAGWSPPRCGQLRELLDRGVAGIPDGLRDQPVPVRIAPTREHHTKTNNQLVCYGTFRTRVVFVKVGGMELPLRTARVAAHVPLGARIMVPAIGC